MDSVQRKTREGTAFLIRLVLPQRGEQMRLVVAANELALAVEPVGCVVEPIRAVGRYAAREQVDPQLLGQRGA